MEYINYKLLRQMKNSNQPLLHRLWERSRTALYFQDQGDGKLYKTEDLGVSYSSDGVLGGDSGYQHEGGFLMTQVFHDYNADAIYFLELSLGSPPDEANVWKLDLTDDSVTDYTTISSAGDTLSGIDVFYCNGALYTFIGLRASGFTDIDTKAYKWTGAAWSLEDSIDWPDTTAYSYTVIVGTSVYFIIQDNDSGNLYLYKFDCTADTFSRVATLGALQVPLLSGRNTMHYDGSNILYIPFSDSTVEKIGLYNISEDSFEIISSYNVSLMLPRDVNPSHSAPFNLEKGLYFSTYKIYQMAANKTKTKLISNATFDGIPFGISDTFIISQNGYIYEYIDSTDNVWDCIIYHDDMDVPSASLRMFDNVVVSDGMWVQILDTYTSAGSSGSAIIFEGYVDDFTEEKIQNITLVSGALEMDNIRPSGQYSGRTDEIITALLSDYTDYIKKGTFSAGTSMGTVRFQGDVLLREILNEYALIDKFIWYLTPTGVLYYNNGTVDSTINYDETDVFHIKLIRGRAIKNNIVVKGAFVDGVQIESVPQQSAESIQNLGKRTYEIVIETIMTIAIANGAGSNILTRLGISPKTPNFKIRDTVAGFIQPGETITFQFDNFDDPIILSDQFGIRNLTYNARQGIGNYEITDVIL